MAKHTPRFLSIVNDAKGRKVEDPATMDLVRRALEQALLQPL